MVIFATQRIINGKMEVDANTMVITAGLGVFFNIVMAGVLKCSGMNHAHSHGTIKYLLKNF